MPKVTNVYPELTVNVRVDGWTGRFVFFGDVSTLEVNTRRCRGNVSCLAWTLDSGRLIFSATSSRMKMSGYRVLAKRDSRTSSWERVKVVRSLRCFLGVAAEQNDTQGKHKRAVNKSVFNNPHNAAEVFYSA